MLRMPRLHILRLNLARPNHCYYSSFAADRRLARARVVLVAGLADAEPSPSFCRPLVAGARRRVVVLVGVAVAVAVPVVGPVCTFAFAFAFAFVCVRKGGSVVDAFRVAEDCCDPEDAGDGAGAGANPLTYMSVVNVEDVGTRRVVISGPPSLPVTPTPALASAIASKFKSTRNSSSSLLPDPPGALGPPQVAFIVVLLCLIPGVGNLDLAAFVVPTYAIPVSAISVASCCSLPCTSVSCKAMSEFGTSEMTPAVWIRRNALFVFASDTERRFKPSWNNSFGS